MWACENATVLEAAAVRLGPVCPPLVCVEGNPSLAARRLLADLREGGAALRYHGDFGTGGWPSATSSSASSVPSRGVSTPQRTPPPWKSARAARRPCRPLTGRVPAAGWDVSLKPAIEDAGVEVEEEHVAEQLLDDLAGVDTQ